MPAFRVPGDGLSMYRQAFPSARTVWTLAIFNALLSVRTSGKNALSAIRLPGLPTTVGGRAKPAGRPCPSFEFVFLYAVFYLKMGVQTTFSNSPKP